MRRTYEEKSTDTKKGAKKFGNASRKNNRRSGGRQSKFDSVRGEDTPTTKKFNDVSWYAKNEAMLRDAASYSYNNPLGSNVPWNNLITGGANLSFGPVQISGSNKAFPGLMSISVLPCIGISTHSGSPANIAAENVYSYVRYMNSGAKNYDQADLMLYLMAMDSIYACWNWGKRAYGYLRTYSQENQYMPKAYLMADINTADLSSNTMSTSLANFRYYLNQAAARISAFCVPAVMPYFIRHSWMFSNIYKDSDTEKAQQYMFVPNGFYKYSETSSSSGGELKALDTIKTTYGQPAMNTLSSYISFLNSMIDAVASSEDVGVMSGDILKAYGQEKLFKLAPIEPDYAVFPVYNEEVLNQIHNLTVVPTKPTWDATYNVTQENGYLKWNPTIQPFDFARSSVLVNMPWQNVTPANTMVGTRLTAVTAASGIQTCGSEIVTRLTVFERTATGKTQKTEYTSFYLKIDPVTDLETYSYGVDDILKITNFDWHPMFIILCAHGSLSALKYDVAGIIGDISNYTLIEKDGLEKLHYTAIMSEFNIPQIGTF